jgi:hypothetical protein
MEPTGVNNQHANMMAAAAARRGNHRRTKSTHPDELNKMMLAFNKEATQDSKEEQKDYPKQENERQRLQFTGNRSMIGGMGGSSSFTEGS